MNNETPEIKNDAQENTYLKNNSEELSTALVQIKEALSTEAGKDIKVAEILGIQTESKNEEPKDAKPKIDVEEVARLQEVIKFANEKLEANGISTDAPIVSKMSDVEKQLAEKQEKMASAKFAEQITELKTLDENLDVKLIESLNMETEDKVIIASLVKSIATPYKEALSKQSEELKSAQEQADINAKFAAPKPDEADGKQKVLEARANFGVKPTDDKKEKTE